MNDLNPTEDYKAASLIELIHVKQNSDISLDISLESHIQHHLKYHHFNRASWLDFVLKSLWTLPVVGFHSGFTNQLKKFAIKKQ